jgi:hypothetical protein
MKPLILLITTFLILNSCSYEQKENEVKDELILLNKAIEHAIITDTIPDYIYLFNNNPYGDTIIITSENDTIFSLLKDIDKYKLKLLTHDEICNLAFSIEENGGFITPNFLEVYKLWIENTNGGIIIGSNCVIPNFGAFDNKMTGMPGDSSRIGKCGFGFLCGGGFFIKYNLKDENGRVS